MRDLHLTRSQRGWLAALLVLALLAAQALGLAHRAAHGPGVGGGLGHRAPAAAAERLMRAGAQVDLASALPAPAAYAARGERSAFDTHDPGGVECRLVDQTTHLDVLLAMAPTAMPPRVPHLRPPVAGEDAGSGSGCAYLARGPPGLVDEGRRRLG